MSGLDDALPMPPGKLEESKRGGAEVDARAEQLEEEEEGTFSSASSRLKFIHAQMLDSSVDADNEEDAAAVVGTLANAMSISISNESARIENAVAMSEMDMAIQNLEKWRQRQRRILAEAASTADDSETPETDENECGSGGESVRAILQRLESELGELDLADATNAINKPPPPRPSRPTSASTAVDKVDLSRLRQQEALLVSASASASVAADADSDADADSSSPELARLVSLIANSNASALLSHELCSIEKVLVGDEVALDEGMAKLADSLRSLEYDYDALLGGGK